MTDWLEELAALKAAGVIRSATPADGEKYKDHTGFLLVDTSTATEIEPYKYKGHATQPSRSPLGLGSLGSAPKTGGTYIQHDTPRAIAGAWCVEHAQQSQGFEHAIRFVVLTESGDKYGTYLWHLHGWQWL